MSTRRRIGEILVAEGAITALQLAEALDQKRAGERLGSTVIRLGMITENQLVDALAAQLGIPVVEVDRIQPEIEAIQLVPSAFATSRELLPLRLDNGTLVVAMADPTNLMILDDLRTRTGVKSIRRTVSTSAAIRAAVGRVYAENAETRNIVKEIEQVPLPTREIEQQPLPEKPRTEDGEKDQQPIIRLVDQIIGDAVRMRASDVHIEPTRDGARVRVRIDGILKQTAVLPKAVRGPLTSRLKIVGNMDIAERRRPQDGRTRTKVDGEDVDIRMSVMPSMHGETTVLRLLRQREEGAGLDTVGLAPDVEEHYRHSLEQPQGLILCTGPTGSGKTTTLYSGLAAVTDETRNVLTLEDPVEYELAGVNQTQVNPRIGFTFASGMRTVLRQDPDVVLVGEIRDEETANLAVEASMTGHLVLSTLHTNDAPSTLSRLTELGVDRRLLANTLLMIMSQRLIRVVCPHCGGPTEVTDHELERLGIQREDTEGLRFWGGKGCGQCTDTGFLGRTTVSEAMVFSPEISDLVMDGASETAIRQAAIKGGMRSLREDAIRVALSGRSTITEALRVTPDDRARDPLAVFQSARASLQ